MTAKLALPADETEQFLESRTGGGGDLQVPLTNLTGENKKNAVDESYSTMGRVFLFNYFSKQITYNTCNS